jgi:hypothetical protein
MFSFEQQQQWDTWAVKFPSSESKRYPMLLQHISSSLYDKTAVRALLLVRTFLEPATITGLPQLKASRLHRGSKYSTSERDPQTQLQATATWHNFQKAS